MREIHPGLLEMLQACSRCRRRDEIPWVLWLDVLLVATRSFGAVSTHPAEAG